MFALPSSVALLSIINCVHYSNLQISIMTACLLAFLLRFQKKGMDILQFVLYRPLNILLDVAGLNYLKALLYHFAFVIDGSTSSGTA